MQGIFKWYITDMILFGLIFGIVIFIFNFFVFIGAESVGYLEIDFFDVGQGDSYLINTVENKNVLVDLGKDNSVLPFLSKKIRGGEVLDLIILTHPDRDHIGNISEVINKYKIKQIIFINDDNDSQEFSELIDVLNQNKSIKIIEPEFGDKLYIDCCTSIDFVWPVSKDRLFKDDPNNNSIGFVLNYNQFSLFGAGDLGLKYENLISDAIDFYAKGDLDVLKVGHHGSKTSTDIRLLQVTTPKHAVIQAGKNNSYGHPHEDVIKNLNDEDIEYLSTQDNGTIKLISDGLSYEIVKN